MGVRSFAAQRSPPDGGGVVEGPTPVARPTLTPHRCEPAGVRTRNARRCDDPLRLRVAFDSRAAKETHGIGRYARCLLQALRESGRQWEAVAVLELAALHNALHSALLGAYGCALAEAGDYQHAFEVFGRAHGTDQPDWRILSAQGAVLDAMGRHEEAQRYYGTALRMAPSEPSVLSNLGLSYALAKDLVRAETTLRQAATRSQRDLGIRQNLALIMSLQGRSSEVEGVSASPRGDQPATAALRELLARQNGWTEERQSDKPQIRAEGT